MIELQTQSSRPTIRPTDGEIQNHEQYHFTWKEKKMVFVRLSVFSGFAFFHWHILFECFYEVTGNAGNPDVIWHIHLPLWFFTCWKFFLFSHHDIDSKRSIAQPALSWLNLFEMNLRNTLMLEQFKFKATQRQQQFQHQKMRQKKHKQNWFFYSFCLDGAEESECRLTVHLVQKQINRFCWI